MDDRQVAKWADDIVFSETGKHLDHIQQSILRGTWQRQKYPEVAENCNRSRAHIRKEASKLWKLLSQRLGEEINQSNFRPTVERYQLSIIASSYFGDYAQIGDHAQSSSINVCVNNTHLSEIPISEQPNQPISNRNKSKLRIDIAEAPDYHVFFDRTSELTTLKQWILENRTRLITIYGLSGIGKTALTLQLIPQIQQEFDYIIYRSLRNSPPLQTLQTNLIQFLHADAAAAPEEKATAAGLPILEYLRSSRCLIILDDVQTIFSSRQLAGHYQPGYENYGTFFKQLTESSHNSCLILLSWEKPREIAALEGENRPCKSLQLNGLGAEAGEIFREKRLAEEEKWSQLIDLYSGNPLWLNIVATMIQDLFGGSVSEFLSYDTLFLGDLESLLDQKCDRLTELEKKVISWLASEAAPVEISKISANLELSPSALLQAVQSLGRRLLIEKVKQGEKTLFTLQPVLMEYVKNQFLKFG